ncbi:MAG TPA: 4Fe-4S binding protein [Terracidiphilus sp.]|nr:4Fe-4S binding protein [Terracidiphilus sp.]
MATQTVDKVTPPAPKKKLVRRAFPNYSQQIRHAAQWAFVALNAWLGVQFYLWVRYFERGGHALYVPRPAGVEGWLPIAGLMNTKYFLSTGRVPAIHPAAMFLFMAFVVMSLLLKKAFCSWLCPVGTLSEHLWQLGKKFFGRTFRLPRWADIPLRGLKYLLLGFFLFFILDMSAGVLADFMYTPYGILADVRMLNFFHEISLSALIVLIVLAFLSMLVQNFWCRYLCPYGALMGIASLLSPMKIRRDTEACIDCAKCARACPAGLHVDKLVQIRSAECTACMECVAVCPAEGALQFALPARRSADLAHRWRRRAAGPAAVAALIAIIFFGFALTARATNHWHTNIPQEMYMYLIPHADDASHPGI